MVHWKTGFKEKDRHCTAMSCELCSSQAAGRRMGREGDNDNKMARIYWNIGLWYQPITEERVRRGI